MNQGIKGMELYLAGWLLALAAFYLGGLDTGTLMPMLVAGANAIALILILVGIRRFADQNKHFKTAKILAAFAFVVSLGMIALQGLSMGGITDWMAIAASCLIVAADILFLTYSGFVLYAFCSLARQEGKQAEAGVLSYLWAIFLTLAIVYLLTQTAAVLLVNQVMPALTYAVPVAGLPMLAAGFWIVVRMVRLNPFQTQTHSG